jgi:hypothetical protein
MLPCSNINTTGWKMKLIDEALELIEKTVNTANQAKLGIDDSLEKKEDDVSRRSFITDPLLEATASQGTYRQKFTRMPNRLLKEASQRDPIIQTILRHRRTQIELFCVRPRTRFDTGFGFIRKDRQRLSSADKESIDYLYDFFLQCGDKDKTPEDDRSRLSDLLGKCTQDALTFGHVCVEKVRGPLGDMQRFRHVPAESMYHVNKNLPKESMDKIINDALQTPFVVRSGSVTEDKEDPLYIQVVESKEVATFSNDTMIFQTYQQPSYIDNNGYSISLVEACILTITKHMQAENYNSLFFTHGFATRGILHLKGSVSQANLLAFRNQFNANIGGNSNSWRTPIVAGLDDIKWVPLAASQRDMEYIQYTDHLIRVLCSQAQCSVEDIGFDYLSRGTQQSTINTPNNEWKLTASAEKGLKPLIRFFEDYINNELMPEIIKGDTKEKFSDLYEFRMIGEEAESPQQEWTRQQAQMSLHASLNNLRTEVDKETLDHSIGGDIPLNQAWMATVQQLLTVGELREALLGDKGAAQRPELQYILNAGHQAWQQFLQTQQQAQDQAAAQESAPPSVSPTEIPMEQEASDDQSKNPPAP